MSKLFANVFMKEHKYNVEEVRKAITSLPVKIRYTNYNKSFHISCFNVYHFVSSEQKEIESEEFIVFEPDLLKMINFDVLLTDTTRKELSEASQFVKDVEKHNTDLAINHYWNISFIQRFFTLTKNTVKEIKKQRHLWKLGREKSPYYILSAIPANRHGGRPIGSTNCLSDEEHERLLYNLKVYDSVAKKCVQTDNFDKFLDFHKELRKLPKQELPDLLKRKFINTKKGILWYFYALRYEFKIKEGVPPYVINPGLDELAERAQELDFPFLYINQGKNIEEIVADYDRLARRCVEENDLERFVNLHLTIRNYSRAPKRFDFINKGGRPIIELLFYIMKSDYLNIDLCDEDAVRALRYYCIVENPIFSKYIHLLFPDTRIEVEKIKEENRKNKARRRKTKNVI